MNVAAVQRGVLVRLGAFAGLSALAAWRYAAVEARPPTARVVAIAASAVVAAAVLSVLHTAGGGRAKAAAARLIVVCALLVVALLAAGIPVSLLRPARWGTLAHHIHGGFGSISTTLWPYKGGDAWTRTDILLGLVVAPIGAAVLGFWPPAQPRRAAALRYRIRQGLALALLLAVYVAGAVDSAPPSIAADGLLLLALIAAWLWLPGLRVRRAGAAVAWVAVAGGLAVLLAGQLGAKQAWLNYRAWGVFGPGIRSVSFSWDQSYGPMTWSRSEQTVFTVSAARAELWKATTLDRFDGLRFVRSGLDDRDSINDHDLPLPLNPRWYTFARFTIGALHSPALPIEQGTAVGVNYARQLRYDRDGTLRTSGAGPVAGSSYTVLAYVPAPTPGQLRAAPRTFPSIYLRYTDFDLPAANQSGLHVTATDPPHPGVFHTVRTVAAPRPDVRSAAAVGVTRRILASPYAGMYRLARRLASGRHSTYDVAMAIQTYLANHYAYSEQPPRRRYPLEAFLFTDRIGYCQQFSGAMALMLRMDGIPARVAAGFLPGVYDSATRHFVVRAVDAHSWVELYFAGIGWVAFNPTPPRTTNPVAGFPSSEPSSARFAAIAATVGSPPRAATAARAAPRSVRSSSVGVVLVALAIFGLLASLAVSARWMRGTVRLRRSLDGDGDLATRELVRALGRLGFALPATVTLTRVESIVRLHGGPDAARYVRLLRERRYAPGSVASATLRDRRRLRLALTAHLGLDARLRGYCALPPATVGWRVVNPH